MGAEIMTPYRGKLYLKDEGDKLGGFQALVEFKIGKTYYYFAGMHQQREGKFYDVYKSGKTDSYGRVYYGDVDVRDVIGYMGNTGNVKPAPPGGIHVHAAVLKNWITPIDPLIH